MDGSRRRPHGVDGNFPDNVESDSQSPRRGFPVSSAPGTEKRLFSPAGGPDSGGTENRRGEEVDIVQSHFIWLLLQLGIL
jgi:hypothetical protein